MPACGSKCVPNLKQQKDHSGKDWIRKTRPYAELKVIMAWGFEL